MSAILNFATVDLLSFDMWYECLPPFVIIGACIAVTGWGLKICDRLFQEGKVFIYVIKSLDLIVYWSAKLSGVCIVYSKSL